MTSRYDKPEVSFLDRRSGLLFHLSSLPGPFGTGGLGRNAERFADFLKDSGFSVWQVLPITPTDDSSYYSPYSGRSAFAGNRLFISPEKLAEDGLLDPGILEGYRRIGQETSADFRYADQMIKELIPIARQRFKDDSGRYSALAVDYKDFVKRESFWLLDHSLFTLLKGKFENLPWNEWPEAFALRDRDTIENFMRVKKVEDDIDLVFFEQFLFDMQWKAFRSFCNGKGISLMGDIPMFVAYDSADVWANR